MLDDDIKHLNEDDGCAWYFIYLFFGVLIFCIFVPLIKSCAEKEIDSTPVEEMHNIDSISKTIENKKEDVVKLDSEKNETIEKVKTLSNDSTLELFRELVWE